MKSTLGNLYIDFATLIPILENLLANSFCNKGVFYYQKTHLVILKILNKRREI